MPIYEYDCTDHGAFELIRPIAEMREPAPCPDCGSPGRRLLSPPHLACVSHATRRARDTNERSAHEPRLVTRGKAPLSDAPRVMQSNPGGRPWVLEHS